jgi:serine phosphatase RsbU (regulator of sigma subunit)
MTLLGHLNTLESAGLVSIAQVEPDLEYLFRHALVREAAYTSLLSVDQRRLHLAAGEAIELLYPDRLEEFAAMLSYHFGEAGDERKATKYCTLAGKAALASFANQEAENHFRCALGLVKDKSIKADLLYLLGEALYSQSRYTETLQTWREGINIYQEIGNREEVARLYARSARAAWHSGDHPQGLRLSQEGLAAVEELPDSATKALLIHEAARAYFFNGVPEEAKPLCRQALEMAERFGALDVQADALTTLTVLPNTSAEEALGSITQAVKIAESEGLFEIATRAYHNFGVATAQHRGDQLAARDYYLRAAEFAHQRGAAQEELFSLVGAAGASLALGDLKSAEAQIASIEQSRSSFQDSDQVNLELESIKFGLYFLQGKLHETIELLGTLRKIARRRGDLQQLYSFCNNLANTYIVLDHIEEVNDWSVAEAAAQEAIETGDRGIGDEVGARCTLGTIFVRQGKLTQAHQLIEAARQKASTSPIVWQEQSLLGLERDLANAEQRWSEALTAAETVCSLLAQLEVRFPWAFSLVKWAEVHVSRGEPIDYERAWTLYREALTLFEEMQAEAYINIINERLRALRAKSYAVTLAHEQVTRELAQAGRIQESFLPEEIPAIDGWEIAATLKPARETSGDFYDFIQLPGGLLGIVVADVADKGMAAALYMTTCRTLIRTYAGEHPSKPERALAEANRRILADTHGGLFITVFYGVLDPACGKMTYCNAGHNPPYLFHSGGEGDPQALTRTGMPLGIIEQTSWEAAVITFQTGDVLVAYTDGVTEAQNESEEFYEDERLLAAARANIGHPAELMQTRFIKDIQDFVGAALQFDDMTLMIVKRQ